MRSLLKADLIAIPVKRGFLPRYAFPLDVRENMTEEELVAITTSSSMSVKALELSLPRSESFFPMAT